MAPQIKSETVAISTSYPNLSTFCWSPSTAGVDVIIFLASTFSHKTVLKETPFALRAEGFEYRIDREKRLLACNIFSPPYRLGPLKPERFRSW
jgi:hypothetical protein